MEPERADREAAFVARTLGRRERVLDLCCGEGRHARRLPLRVVGVDLNQRSLRTCGVPCARADMRRLPFRAASFDGVVNLFSSFGYLESDAEDESVLREVARVLRPGG